MNVDGCGSIPMTTDRHRRLPDDSELMDAGGIPRVQGR